MNDDNLSVRLPSKLKNELKKKIPNATERNLTLRALIQAFINGKINVNNYVVELNS